MLFDLWLTNERGSHKAQITRFGPPYDGPRGFLFLFLFFSFSSAEVELESRHGWKWKSHHGGEIFAVHSHVTELQY